MKKFTIIDYIIIILIICAIAFAFIHISTDDSSDIQKTAFDASTINKIPDTYSDYYKNGNIVKATVVGLNSSNNKEVTLNGTVTWIGDDGGSDVSILIESDNGTYLAGLYKNVPNADIYIDTISLESDGSKYDNLVEFKISPEKINSLNDLCKNLTDCDCDITTTVTVDSIDTIKLQEIANKLNSNDKKASIKASTSSDSQIIITKATVKDINTGNSILGNINGVTDQITIRVYNCSDNQLETIKNNYDVTNIKNF